MGLLFVCCGEIFCLLNLFRKIKSHDLFVKHVFTFIFIQCCYFRLFCIQFYWIIWCFVLWNMNICFEDIAYSMDVAVFTLICYLFS
jgi:hypothetical protein